MYSWFIFSPGIITGRIHTSSFLRCLPGFRSTHFAEGNLSICHRNADLSTTTPSSIHSKLPNAPLSWCKLVPLLLDYGVSCWCMGFPILRHGAHAGLGYGSHMYPYHQWVAMPPQNSMKYLSPLGLGFTSGSWILALNWTLPGHPFHFPDGLRLANWCIRLLYSVDPSYFQALGLLLAYLLDYRDSWEESQHRDS